METGSRGVTRAKAKGQPPHAARLGFSPRSYVVSAGAALIRRRSEQGAQINSGEGGEGGRGRNGVDLDRRRRRQAGDGRGLVRDMRGFPRGFGGGLGVGGAIHIRVSRD